MIELTAGDARLLIDAAAGGRLASLRIGDLELMVTEADDPLGWGCYAMVPWTGRVPGGRFTFEGRDYHLPITQPSASGGHAIHGTAWGREWQEDGEGRLSIALGAAWPLGGRALQQVELEADRLRLSLEVPADEVDFPAALDWHPWFRRQLSRGRALRLEFSAEQSYVMTPEAVPTGELRGMPEAPWNDCFVGVAHPPRLVWEEALRLELHADVDHWVVYDRPTHALCVEPMTGPPNALNLGPRVVEPGRPLRAEFEWIWSD